MKKTTITKQTKTVSIEEHEYSCDRCKRDIEEHQYPKHFKCTIQLEIGQYFIPAGIDIERQEVHLCEECAIDFFEKSLPQLGITVNKEIVD